MHAGSTLLSELEDDVSAFTNTMPEAYVASYQHEECAEHAAIVLRRGASAVYLERWRELPDGGALVCVVADDRAGLLSLICTALLRHGIEVRVAQVYSRRLPDGSREAVDFFWLRARNRSGSPRAIAPDELQVVLRTLNELVKFPPELSPMRDAGSLSPVPRVFFNTKALRNGEYVLVVEVRDYPGLLHAITTALHAEGVGISESDIRTEGDLACDCFVLARPAGGSLSPDRLAAIRQTVVAAIRAGWQQQHQC